MNLAEYKAKRAQLQTEQPKYRTLCSVCVQPDFCCYCPQVRRFDPKINFVVLIHPIEVKRRIATGRMSHLCLEDSYLIQGHNYTNDATVNALINDNDYHSVILYPGTSSVNVSPMTENEKQQLFPKEKKLRVFVIDGTWATAIKMTRQSENLKSLPRICFTPSTPSNFRVRKQPNSNCYSTIEAIHHTIELLGKTQNFNVDGREHDQLLAVFNYMVERQLHFIKESRLQLRTSNYRSEGQARIVLA